MEFIIYDQSIDLWNLFEYLDLVSYDYDIRKSKEKKMDFYVLLLIRNKWHGQCVIQCMHTMCINDIKSINVYEPALVRSSAHPLIHSDDVICLYLKSNQ